MKYVDKKDPWSSHTYILKYLKLFPPGTKILDVGTASGVIGRGCIGSNFILDGIEPDLQMSRLAQEFYTNFLVSEIATAPREFIQGHDVVIFADVLEHLVDPMMVLNYVVSLQGDDTTYIISVPNIANIWIRVNLLFGNFNYTDRGILDKTHLRFFTRKTLLTLLHTCGLRAVSFCVTPIPLNLINLWFENNVGGRIVFSLLSYITHIFPNLFGYQFILFARK